MCTLLTQMTDDLADWLKANYLSLNAKISCYMVFNRIPIRQASMIVNLKINDEPLENVTTTKLLGIYIDEKLKCVVYDMPPG